MKLGTFFSQLEVGILGGEAKNLDEVLDILSPKGLSYVDVAAATFDINYTPKSLVEALNKHNVNVGSVFHLISFDYKKENILKELREDTKKRLSDCAEAECSLLMPVPVIKDEHINEAERIYCRDVVAEYLADVVNEAKQYGITVILENFSDTKCPFATISDIKYMLDTIPELYYALDTGNFWFGGTDVLEAAECFKEKTRHIHVKDILPCDNGRMHVCGRTCDSVAIGQGETPFPEIFKILTEQGYDERATIEINHNENLINKTVQSLDYLNKLLMGER